MFKYAFVQLLLPDRPRMYLFRDCLSAIARGHGTCANWYLHACCLMSVYI